MEVIQVTDYDVLADEMPGPSFVLKDYQKHIGNTRFGVLLDMYQEAFEMSYMQQKDDDCRKIVQRIVDVTCHKDVSIIVTKGRFLGKKNGEGNWFVLDEEKAIALVHQVLSNPEDDDGGEDNDDAAEAYSVPSSLSGMTINEEKKRRRRSSLLRRSVSETGILGLDDKKKILGVEDDDSDDDDIDADTKSQTSHMSTVTTASAPATIRRVHSNSLTSNAIPTKMSSMNPAPLARHKSVPIPSSNGLIASPKGMDVVLAENGVHLTSREGIVGNNRLHVMLTLQGARYKTLDASEQDKVAKDLVKAVCQYWGGRMLVQQGLTYRKLDDDESLVSMKALLSATSEGGFTTIGRSTSTSISPTPISSLSMEPKPLLSAPQPPAFLKNASMDLLSVSGTGRTPNMQSQAVKSLQQRKAKRAIAKTLGQTRSIPDNFPDFHGSSS